MSDKHKIKKKITVPKGSESKPAPVQGPVKPLTSSDVTLNPFDRKQEVFSSLKEQFNDHYRSHTML